MISHIHVRSLAPVTHKPNILVVRDYCSHMVQLGSVGIGVFLPFIVVPCPSLHCKEQAKSTNIIFSSLKL